MTWKARGQHIDKHASLENLVYQMNIIQQKGQTFFHVSDYSTGPLLFSYKATVIWLYGWLNHVKSIWYYKQHGKTGINILIIYMATRSTFKCVNYLHRSDIYVRLTRTNLQSNSHYQKKKTHSSSTLAIIDCIYLFILSQPKDQERYCEFIQQKERTNSWYRN